MKRTLLTLTILSLSLLLPGRLLADCNRMPGERIIPGIRSGIHSMILLNDTIPASSTSEISTKEKPAVERVNEKATAGLPNGETKETLIKAVPKSRRQSKPKVVNPAIEIKPIRVIKPKIIRKIGPL